MDAATVSIPVSITALVGAAFFAGKLTQKVEDIRSLVSDMKKDAREATAAAEARARESSKDQGQRLGKIDDELAVLRDFKARTEGEERGRRKERADTRGIPVHTPGRDEPSE